MYNCIHNAIILDCLIQGVLLYSTVILTDPAIHSTTPGSYGFTDHGEAGVKNFSRLTNVETFASRWA